MKKDSKEYSFIQIDGKYISLIPNHIQMYEISQAKFNGYQTLFQQKLKWYRAFEQRLKRIKIKKNKDKE